MASAASVKRQAQRDSTTVLIGAVMVLVSTVFDITDADVIAASTTILTVLSHRVVKST